LRRYATSRKFAGSILDGVFDIILPAALWPWIDSATSRNEYQEYFLEDKGGRCVRMTAYQIHVENVLKSGSLILQETSGSVQACTGIYLPVQRKCCEDDKSYFVVFIKLWEKCKE
jgi:hypothetical protein